MASYDKQIYNDAHTVLVLNMNESNASMTCENNFAQFNFELQKYRVWE